MKIPPLFLLALILALPRTGVAQTDSSALPLPQVSGYVSEMGSLMILSRQDEYVWDNSLHNRLKASWQPVNWLDFDCQLRNRFLWGQTFNLNPGYAASLDKDRGLFDLSWNLASGNRYVLNSTLDRASVRFTANRFELTAGRQRINWGQTFVWNPNDIFNTYSFFEFDYPERPGSDALRLQYFSGTANSLELAVKSDNGKKITAAGLVKFTAWNYDFQVLGGVLSQEDWVAGIGWSGNIKGTGFRGECSYFHPEKNWKDTTGLLLLSLSADYSFSNSWVVQAEMLYRRQSKNTPEKNILDYYYAPATVKNLAFTDFAAFIQLSIPVSPLVNASLAVMGLPGMKGYYAGPSCSLSLSDNIEAAVYCQIFHGKFPEYEGGPDLYQTFFLNFLRLKWNF